MHNELCWLLGTCWKVCHDNRMSTLGTFLLFISCASTLMIFHIFTYSLLNTNAKKKKKIYLALAAWPNKLQRNVFHASAIHATTDLFIFCAWRSEAACTVTGLTFLFCHTFYHAIKCHTNIQKDKMTKCLCFALERSSLLRHCLFLPNRHGLTAARRRKCWRCILVHA